MTSKIKEPVRIRQKKLKNGNVSLYLDIYANGQRTYEFLKLYLIPEENKAAKAANKDTLQRANLIKSQRILDIQNGRFGIKTNTADKVLFFEYFENYIKEKKIKNPRWWLSCLKHLKIYEKRHNITLAAISVKWVQGFYNYLETAVTTRREKQFNNEEERLVAARKRLTPVLLSENTRRIYFNSLCSCLNHAYNDGLIDKNPAKHVKGFKGEDTERQYLTIDELRLLVATECDDAEVKRAFLFSCLTGLRRSDISKLTWGEVKKENGRTRLIFKQKKTGGQEYLDITSQAGDLIGDRKDAMPTDFVFGDIRQVSVTNIIIRRWAEKAGIEKHLSFHCARHTFATMMLTLGADIYTVSKLLGHQNLKTTQIYAKIIDEKKREAVDIIPDIL